MSRIKMRTKTLVCPHFQSMNLAGYCSASLVAFRIAVGCAVLVSASLMQSCATHEMNAAELEEVPSSNAAAGQSAPRDPAADVADPAPEIFSFEKMYRERYKTTPDEQE